MHTSKSMFAAPACALAVFVPALAHANGTVVLKESFNNVGALTNRVQVNNGTPPGLPWFQAANYIGIDTVSVTAVPEPSAWIAGRA
jgi:hypothetical protein